LKILMTSRKLWTLSGKLFTINWTKLLTLALRLSSPNSLLATLQPSTLLTKTFFALAEYLRMIWSVLLRLLEAKFKLLQIP